MKRGNIFRFIIMPIIIFGAGILFYMQYTTGFNGSTDSNLEFIKAHINSRGQLVDLQDEISVKSSEDIKFYFGDKVEIEFGEVLLKWDKEDFLTNKVREQLKEIGIKMKVNKKTNRIHLFYQDVEIVRWVS